MSLSPEQELLVREFYENVATNDDLFPDQPVQARQLRGICLGLLGYTVAFGKIIRQEDLKGHKYGQEPELEDRWAADTAKLRQSLSGDAKSETSTGEQS